MIATVRDARAEDATAIEDLDALARSLAANQRGGNELLAWNLPDSLPTVGSRDWQVSVGEVDGVVVAVARIERRGDRGVVHQIFTHPDARRVGLGHQLLVAAMAQMRGWGCGALESSALPGDRETKNFFEAHGMKSRLLVVHSPVEPD